MEFQLEESFSVSNKSSKTPMDFVYVQNKFYMSGPRLHIGVYHGKLGLTIATDIKGRSTQVIRCISAALHPLPHKLSTHILICTLQRKVDNCWWSTEFSGLVIVCYGCLFLTVMVAQRDLTSSIEYASLPLAIAIMPPYSPVLWAHPIENSKSNVELPALASSSQFFQRYIF